MRGRANSMMASINRLPIPARREFGRTYMPTSRPLCASFVPVANNIPAVPTISAPWKAPNISELPRRSENHVSDCAFSRSKVLPNASGERCSPSSRMSLYDAASENIKRRICTESVRTSGWARDSALEFSIRIARFLALPCSASPFPSKLLCSESNKILALMDAQ